MRIGLLTGGGDCPGLNAAIRGVVVRSLANGVETVGVLNGWQGLMRDNTRLLDRDAVRGIIARGGTILGTSRLDPYVHGQGMASLQPTIERLGLDGLVVIGGDGTLASALQLAAEGLPVVGIPKTIDNDIPGTDTTFGFNTAVEIATQAIDRLTTTAEAHQRVMLVEVMGRTKGWIATYAGMAAGADAILIPERGYDLEQVAAIIQARLAKGRTYSIVVVAEGIQPPGGSPTEKLDVYGFKRLGGVAYAIAPHLERLSGVESRVTVLGHLQRGGTPTASDRVLATRFGVAAADLVRDGKWGSMAALRGGEVVAVELEEACRQVRSVDSKTYDTAAVFFEH